MFNFRYPLNYQLKDDIIAGITVGIVTIPQGMAFALLAGLPPIYGLYGSFIPLLVYGLLGSSNFLNVGPVSVISIFIFNSLSPFVTPFTDEYVNAVIILGLMIGILQCLGGLLKLGKYVVFIPKAVIAGFIQAAAVVIIISQLSPALGFEIPLGSNYGKTLAFMFEHLDSVHLSTFTLFTFSLLALFGTTRWFPSFPMAIVLLFISGAMAFLFHFETMGIALIGEVPEGLPALLIPAISWELLNYLPSAFGIAFVATVGSFVMAKNVENKQSHPWNPNQDMFALGISKIVGAFFGSLISAGSFNRSILTLKAGAKTQIAGLIGSLVIFFTLLFLTPIIYYLPQAVIAAIIVYSVYFLFDFTLIKNLWKTDRKQLSLLLITAFSTLLLGFVEGIIIGLISSLGTKFTWKKSPD